MTINELKKYRKLVFSIRYWKREYEEMAKASYISSPKFTGTPGSTDAPDPTSDRALRELKMQRRILKLVAEQEAEAEKIMDWIETIEDPMIRTIMHARYIRGKSWTAVAAAVGGGNTPDSCRMQHNRYLFDTFGEKAIN